MINSFFRSRGSYLIIYLAGVTLLGACTKEDSAYGPGSYPSANYQPTNPQAYWHYTIQGGTPSQDLIMTSTSSDTTINGQLSHIFQISSLVGIAPAYFYQAGGDYHMTGGIFYNNLQNFLNNAQLSLGATDILYLKDNVPILTAWNGGNVSGNLGNGITFSAQYQFMILQTGITKTILGNNFVNVIHELLRIPIQIQGGGVTTNPELDVDYYFAKGVGMIQDSVTSPTNNISQVQNLQNYSIP